MQNGKIIVCTKQYQNLFVLDLAVVNKVMQVKTTITLSPINGNLYKKSKAMVVHSQGRPIYIVSKSKQVKVWYCRFCYTSNIRVIRAAKLLIGMGDFTTKYDIIKVYSNFEQSESDNKS